MFRFNDSVRIKEVEKLYGRSETLIKTLEEIKEKEIIGKVISIDEEDCILTVYVSFKGYDNLWMSEEELEKVNAYDNLKIVENIDDFIDTMKKVYEEELEMEEVELEELLDEVEIKEEVEKDLDEVVRDTEDKLNKTLLDYLINKFEYNGIEEVLDDYYDDKLLEHMRKDNCLLSDGDNYAIMSTIEEMKKLFNINRDDIQMALERKESESKNEKIDDDDDLIF